jgi:LmeA-like phospholipid-binding
MFGAFPSLKDSPGTDWGEKILNTVASQTIRHMFTASEAVEIAIRCHPSSKLLQGSIDSLKMSGRGLVIRQAFRVAEMTFETDVVAIDFSSVLQGKISLKQPAQAVAFVVLSQADINHAFTAELVTKRLQNLDAPELTAISGGEPVSFTDVEVQLMPENQLKIIAKADLPNCANVPVSMTATLAVERRRRISFQNPQFCATDIPEPMQAISQILTAALAQILDNMVDLDRFNLDGVTMRINRLETQGKNLVFSGYAQIERVPNNP